MNPYARIRHVVQFYRPDLEVEVLALDQLLAWARGILDSATEDERCDQCGQCLYCEGRDILQRLEAEVPEE